MYTELIVFPAPALPRSASWAQKGGTAAHPSSSAASLSTASGSNGRTTRNNNTSNSRSAAGTPSRSTAEVGSSSSTARTRRSDRKSAATATSTARSRPSTPPSSLPPRPSAAVEAAAALPPVPVAAASQSTTPVKAKADRPSSPSRTRKQQSSEKVPTLSVTKKKSTVLPPAAEEEAPLPVPAPVSPIPTSIRVQDIRQESLPGSVPPLSPASTTADSLPSTSTPPPPPPGLGLPSYQLSNQARALMDDVLNRRASATIDAVSVSPFPDFDRTLSSLGDGTFSFNLTSDPKVARSLQQDVGLGIPMLSSSPTASSFFDPFSSNSALPSPINPHFGGGQPNGAFPLRPNSSSGAAASPLSSVSDLDPRISRERSSVAGSSSYVGSFNPFSESGGGIGRTESPAPSSSSALEEDPLRRGSKFGFARKESVGPGFSGFGGSATNSPLRYTDNIPLPVTPIFSTIEPSLPKPGFAPPGSWGYGGGRDMGMGSAPLPPPGLLPPPDKNSPRIQYQSPQAGYASVNSMQQQQQHHHQFSPFAPGGLGGPSSAGPNDLSINLRELLNIHERPADVFSLEQGKLPRRVLVLWSHLFLFLARHEQLLHQQQAMFPGQSFVDPAIMSMSMNSGYREQGFMNAGPMHGHNMPATPPGLDSMPPFGRRQSSNIPMASPSGASNGMSSSLLRGGNGTYTESFLTQGRYYPF